MKYSLALAILFLLPQPLTAADRVTRYTVELDIDLRDEASVCGRAWIIARQTQDTATATAMTATRGTFDAPKCLEVLYRAADMGEGISNVGVYVRERQ